MNLSETDWRLSAFGSRVHLKPPPNNTYNDKNKETSANKKEKHP